MTGSALWPSPWPAEDGGPRRTQTSHVAAGPKFRSGTATSVHREAIASTMVVLRAPGEVFVLRHEIGPRTNCWVERLDPHTLETIARSEILDGGPTWPGGLAAHANGSLYVVYGATAHRLSADLRIEAHVQLPRDRPYNSFVVLPDGCLATKDFGGALPGTDLAHPPENGAELVVLHPDDLHVVDALELPEPSVARLSADDSMIYVVGVDHLLRVRWNGSALTLDDTFMARYRTSRGQGHGWDAVIALGAAWFLDNGEGTQRYAGTLRGQGIATEPLHLVRVDLRSAEVMLQEVCGMPGGLVANPPLIDEARRIAVAYDSGNGELVAFDIAGDGSLRERWRRQQNHACHPLLFADSGELVTNDHDMQRMADELVVLAIETGEEHLRVDTGSAVQSVLFLAPGWERDVYYCSFAGIARIGSNSHQH